MTQMGHPGTAAQVKAAAQALFDVPVAIAVTDPRMPQPAMLAGEAALVERAQPARRTEFAAGRAAARCAMTQLGLAPSMVLAGDDRAPIWPDGLVGSISHTKTLCIAALSDRDISIGIDVEEDTALDADLIPAICTPLERKAIAGRDVGPLAKLIFSAKEAAYKAQYPLTGALFGFDHLEITLDLAAHRFVATFVQPAGCFSVGDTLPGRFAHVAHHLVTAVTVGSVARKGR